MALPKPPKDLPIRDDIVDCLEREWSSLASPGSVHTAAEQIALAAAYRKARTNPSPATGLDPVHEEVVVRLTRGPSRIRRDWVEGLEARGVEALAYVEIVSVVSRIAAVDGFHRMLGIDLPGFPDPEPAPPTNAFDLNARPGRGFVPMTKGYGLWWALSLIPAAYRRMEDLHNTLYLTPEQMLGDGSPRRASRPQIELVATRTAALNECFY